MKDDEIPVGCLSMKATRAQRNWNGLARNRIVGKPSISGNGSRSEIAI